MFVNLFMRAHAASSEFFCDWASSGQSVCQLSGQRSLRETLPFVSFSIIGIQRIGIGLLPLAQLLTDTLGTFSLPERLEALSILVRYSFRFIVEIC